MRPKKLETTSSGNLFRTRLDQIIDMKHELVRGVSGLGETSGCGRRNRSWRTEVWIHRLPKMSVRRQRARRSAPMELAEAIPWAGRRGDFQRSGNAKLSAG